MILQQTPTARRVKIYTTRLQTTFSSRSQAHRMCAESFHLFKLKNGGSQSVMPEVRLLVTLGVSVSGYPKRGAGSGADGSLVLPFYFLTWVLVTQVCAL